MAAPTISYPMLCRFVPRFLFRPLLHSAASSQTSGFLRFPRAAAAPPFTSLRASVIRAFSDEISLSEDAGIESERGVDAIPGAEEGFKSLNLGEIRALPSLTVKEKKDLASYAHSLGKKLKSQQVGKSGVTETVVAALSETLEANELLKLKIHGSCPGEIVDVVNQLELGTGSVVVGQIGRTVILYRPSMTKLKAEEKKKQAQKAHLERLKRFTQNKKPASFSRQEQRNPGRGRRGSSKSLTSNQF